MDPVLQLREAIARVRTLVERQPARTATFAAVLITGAGMIALARAPAAQEVPTGLEQGATRALLPRPASYTGPWGVDGTGRTLPASSSVAAVALDRPLPPEISPADFAFDLAPVPRDARVSAPSSIRGIYVNAWSAGSGRKWARLIDLADRTEINAFVVDVKDATGYVSYDTRVPLARQIGAHRDVRVGDIRGRLTQLRQRGIYPIARIVVFKDPLLAQRRPDMAIQDTTGAVWTDHHGDIWVDSYNEDVWEYNIALAREAIALGFSEVQWDYVRFPDVPWSHMRTAVFPAREGRTREDAIRQFLLHSRESLADLEVLVTADVFGLTTSSGDDMGIGQRWSKMVDATDALLPMVYPSHYYRGSYGFSHPNAYPYEVVKTAMEHALARSRGVEHPAEIRPWLQDFSLGQPAYGPAHVRAQIEAVYDSGLDDWILWNPASNYTEAALAPANGPAPRFPRPRPDPVTPRDSLGLLGRDAAGPPRR